MRSYYKNDAAVSDRNLYYSPGMEFVNPDTFVQPSSWRARIVAGILVAGLIFTVNKFEKNSEPKEKAPSFDKIEAITPSMNPEIAAMHPKLAAFVTKYREIADKVESRYGLPAQVIMAQAILESAYGESGHTQNANNDFGLKAGSDWNGPVYEVATREYTDSGEAYTTIAKFKKFESPEAGWLGYGEYITTRGFYDDAAQVYKETGSQTEYIRRLVDGNGPKYATDPHYADKVLELVNLQRALENQPPLEF